jgi:hypothetical protein
MYFFSVQIVRPEVFVSWLKSPLSLRPPQQWRNGPRSSLSILTERWQICLDEWPARRNFAPYIHAHVWSPSRHQELRKGRENAHIM